MRSKATKRVWISTVGLSIQKCSSKIVFRGALCALLFTLWAAAHAQQKKIAQIGYLSPLSGPPPVLMAFKEGLRDLGWVEGKNVRFEERYASGQPDKYSELATELVRLEVDVIVAGPGGPVTGAAKRVTTTIPIVMASVVDPVNEGLVASLARPGANVTGVTVEVTREQAGKNLELLKQAVPQVSHVTILRNPKVSAHIPYGEEAERVAKALGVTVHFADLQVRTDKGLEETLSAVVKERTSALLVTPNPFFADRRQQIINFATQHRLPSIYGSATFVEDGGLMSYGHNPKDTWRRVAVYVDKILKGAKPADLPVERPMKFEMVINLKTAKEIGFTIPPNVLARADRVIR